MNPYGNDLIVFRSLPKWPIVISRLNEEGLRDLVGWFRAFSGDDLLINQIKNMYVILDPGFEPTFERRELQCLFVSIEALVVFVKLLVTDTKMSKNPVKDFLNLLEVL